MLSWKEFMDVSADNVPVSAAAGAAAAAAEQKEVVSEVVLN